MTKEEMFKAKDKAIGELIDHISSTIENDPGRRSATVGVDNSTPALTKSDLQEVADGVSDRTGQDIIVEPTLGGYKWEVA